MAQTKKGQKFNRVASYIRVVKDKKKVVRVYDKSNPNTSKGEKK